MKKNSQNSIILLLYFSDKEGIIILITINNHPYQNKPDL